MKTKRKCRLVVGPTRAKIVTSDGTYLSLSRHGIVEHRETGGRRVLDIKSAHRVIRWAKAQAKLRQLEKNPTVAQYIALTQVNGPSQTAVGHSIYMENNRLAIDCRRITIPELNKIEKVLQGFAATTRK